MGGDASTIPEYHRPTRPEASYSYKAGVGSGATSIEYYRQRVAYRPVISRERCLHNQGCTACVDVCPGGALSCGDELPVQNVSRCMLCSACKEVCEFGALEFSPHPEIMSTLEKQGTPSSQA
jgi:ferredoxin